MKFRSIVMNAVLLFISQLLACDLLQGDELSIAKSEALSGWIAKSPRDEIRPAFSSTPAGGPSNSGCLVITHDHVYVVSSTFMAPKDGWMSSAVFDQTGKAIAKADTLGELAIADVDLNRPYIGPWNLGDFRSMVPRHRPEKAGN